MKTLRVTSALVSSLIAIAVAAHAEAGEKVFVKYRGTVDLAPFKCVWTESSLVKRLCYDKRNEYLLVSLKGTYYHYCKLPVPVLQQWTASDSLGRYFNANIKGNFDCRVYPPPTYN